jgi:protein SCO1
MRPRSRILPLALVTVLVLALALVVLLGRPSSPAPSAPAPAVEHASSSGFDGALLPGHVSASDFTLTDQTGRRVSVARYRGRVVLLSFLSTACAPTCPLVAQQIRGALDELDPPRAPARPGPADSVPVLIVSADPAADTPARVRRFLAAAALGGRVEYLTGPRAELRRVWRAYGVVPAQLADAGSAHPAEVLLIDRAGDERDLFQVEELTPEALAHDVRRLEGER